MSSGFLDHCSEAVDNLHPVSNGRIEFLLVGVALIVVCNTHAPSHGVQFLIHDADGVANNFSLVVCHW